MHLQSPLPAHDLVQKTYCQTNLLNVLVALEDWTRPLDFFILSSQLAKAKGHDLDITYLDFQKVFDSVPHQRLLKNLSEYGFQGKVIHWIESFLIDRTQQVAVGNATSRWVSI